jgi:flagellar brake protein
MEPDHLLQESADLLQESEDPYLVAQPAEILRILQDMHRKQTFVTVTLPRGQNILTLLLQVEERAGYLLFDIGRNRAETEAVLSLPQVHFSSSLHGVSVRFTTPTPVETTFEGAPAFRAPLPMDLRYIQRREHYRTKVIRPALCTAKLAGGQTVQLIMTDLSLGGVRLQSSAVRPDLLPRGLVLQNALLDFAELGKLEVNLFVASHQTLEYEGLSTYLYGCHIQALPRSKESIVQRIVFALELLNRPNTRSLTSSVAK